MLNSLKTASAL